MQKRKLSTDDAAILVLVSAILFGTWLRIMPIWLAGFPINDGGMFYTMIEDLDANHYALPLFTTYNHLNIPFVYPPLGFYIGAGLTDLFNLASPLLVIQWLPGVLNSLCIPAFYLLAKEISGNKLQSAISTLVFAFIPHMTAWFSMGGGLTRSLGAFFMLLALVHIHRVFVTESQKDIWGSVIFSSLAVLSHTEAPIYTTAIAIYIWAMKNRSIKGLLNGILIAIGVLVLTSPWLALIISRHGLAPLLSAGQTSFRSTWSVLRLINIDFITEEPYLDLLGAMGIIGMAILVSRKNFFIPGMFLVIFLSHPRSAHTVGNIPLAMAAGFLVADILLPAITRVQGDTNNPHKTPRYGLPILLAVLIPYILSNSLYYGILLSKKHVSESERSAMQWVAENTPGESAFLIITGEPNGFCDSTSEWFPTLTDRKSLATLQGNEWLQGDNFGKFAGDTQNLQACSKKGLDCLTQEANHFSPSFDYLYISLNSPTSDCAPANASDITRSLILELEQSTQFQAVFTSDDAAIFKKR
ncbi:MAG: glycosyltransferase family 39 protein [Anaerolineales bacterium]|nr:glycosyltransferase family 39 protein [Anaerolineales bacterium]